MAKMLLRYKATLLGIVLGALAGYACYALVGCHNGHCMIGAKPLNSTLYFAVVGALMLNTFDKK
jgi:hypothetical protein